MDEPGSAGDREGHYVLVCLAGNAEAIAKVIDRLYYLKWGTVMEKNPDLWEIRASQIIAGRSPIKAREGRKKLAILNCVVDTIRKPDVTLFGSSVVNKLVKKREKEADTHRAPTFIPKCFELLLRSCGSDARSHIMSDTTRRGAKTRTDRIFYPQCAEATQSPISNHAKLWAWSTLTRRLAHQHRRPT